VEDDGEDVESQLQELGELQKYLEDVGVIPVLNDGFVGGNCAMLLGKDNHLFVSKSGKPPHASLGFSDFVQVEDFDENTWSAKYKSKDMFTCPSSDTPIHVAALLNGAQNWGWSEVPKVAVHGHALAEGRGLTAAQELGLPISSKITNFSTKDDRDELVSLFKKFPYPQNCCFIRRGHGFLLLAKDVRHARYYFNAVLDPLIIGSHEKDS
jgi:hypothetical protein